jgi:hypothetical protein
VGMVIISIIGLIRSQVLNEFARKDAVQRLNVGGSFVT